MDIDPDMEASWLQFLRVNTPLVLPRTAKQLEIELRSAYEHAWQARGECQQDNGGDLAA